MPAFELLTVEQFVAERDELPDRGRWTELLAGRRVNLQPPTIEHGTAVLNLGKALAAFAQRGGRGYACFDLGLIVARNPDTLRVPAVSVFLEGPLFAESDKIVTETRPAIVAEVASTNDRRRNMRQRVSSWLDWGVPLVWILDPQSRELHVFEQGGPVTQLAAENTLRGGSVLTDFQVSVADLFKEPGWAQ